MPITGTFSDDLSSTDLVFGVSDGIRSMYDLYKKRSVYVDKNNQGRYFLTDQSKLDTWKKTTEKKTNSKGTVQGKTTPKDTQSTLLTYSANGLAKNQEYLTALNNGQVPAKYAESAPLEGIEAFGSRRKCKSILYWQLITKQLRVQFVVSGIDLAKVPTKEIVTRAGPTGKYSSDPSNKDAGITDAELRWVFRNRKNLLVDKNVQFWKSPTEKADPVPCQAPWNMPDYQKAWKKYELSIGSKFDITVVGSGPNDPLVFEYDLRSGGNPIEVVSGKTDAWGHASAPWKIDLEIRFRGFGSFGRVETQWQSILPSRYMNLQFGRYRFICEPRTD